MSTKANEIAALERKMKDTLNKTIQAALKKKIERLKTEMKGEKPMTANQLATTLLKAKGKVREMNSKEFSAMIKRLSAKPEYKFLKGMEKSDIERDLERQAKPVGWRFRGSSTRKPTAKEIAAGKKSGKVYFEDRANRSDVSRVAQLKTGGPAGSDWKVTDVSKAKYLGPIEFQDNDGEHHYFEVMETDDKLVFGGHTNTGFIESGYIEKDGFSTDEALQELLADLEVYYNDGKKFTSMIVVNDRMAKGGKTGRKYSGGGGVGADEGLFDNGQRIFLFKGKTAKESKEFYDDLTNLMPDHEITMINDNIVQAFFGNYSDLEDAIKMAKSHGVSYQGKYAKGGGVGRKDGFRHKITVEDKLGKVHDVALFSAKGDAAICLKALQKSQTSGLSYKLKLG